MLRLFLRFFGPTWSVAVQIRLYIFYCSIFSPQMQGFSCIWVIFLSKAKKSSSQELSYGIESFKPPASKKQMIFGVRLDAALVRHFVFPMGHIHSRPRRNHGVLFVLTNCKQSRSPLPKTEKI